MDLNVPKVSFRSSLPTVGGKGEENMIISRVVRIIYSMIIQALIYLGNSRAALARRTLYYRRGDK